MLPTVLLCDTPLVGWLPFAQQPHNTPGYRPRYVPVLAVQLPPGESFALVEVHAQVTLSCKGFMDFRTGKKGSAFANTQLALCDDLPPLEGEPAPRGLQFGPYGGENLSDQDNRRPYYQPVRAGVLLRPAPGFWVVLFAFCASEGGQEPQGLSLPTTGPYHQMIVKCSKGG